MSDDLSLSLIERPHYKLDPLGVVLNSIEKDIAECTASHDARPRRKLEGMPLATTFFRLGYFQPEGAEGRFLLVLKVAFLALLVTQTKEVKTLLAALFQLDRIFAQGQFPMKLKKLYFTHIRLTILVTIILAVVETFLPPGFNPTMIHHNPILGKQLGKVTELLLPMMEVHDTNELDCFSDCNKPQAQMLGSAVSFLFTAYEGQTIEETYAKQAVFNDMSAQFNFIKIVSGFLKTMYVLIYIEALQPEPVTESAVPSGLISPTEDAGTAEEGKRALESAPDIKDGEGDIPFDDIDADWNSQPCKDLIWNTGNAAARKGGKLESGVWGQLIAEYPDMFKGKNAARLSQRYYRQVQAFKELPQEKKNTESQVDNKRPLEKEPVTPLTATGKKSRGSAKKQ